MTTTTKTNTLRQKRSTNNHNCFCFTTDTTNKVGAVIIIVKQMFFKAVAGPEVSGKSGVAFKTK